MELVWTSVDNSAVTWRIGGRYYEFQSDHVSEEIAMYVGSSLEETVGEHEGKPIRCLIAAADDDDYTLIGPADPALWRQILDDPRPVIAEHIL